jgi:hypothetical protein
MLLNSVSMTLKSPSLMGMLRFIPLSAMSDELKSLRSYTTRWYDHTPFRLPSKTKSCTAGSTERSVQTQQVRHVQPTRSKAFLISLTSLVICSRVFNGCEQTRATANLLTAVADWVPCRGSNNPLAGERHTYYDVAVPSNR